MAYHLDLRIPFGPTAYTSRCSLQVLDQTEAVTVQQKSTCFAEAIMHLSRYEPLHNSIQQL